MSSVPGKVELFVSIPATGSAYILQAPCYCNVVSKSWISFSTEDANIWEVGLWPGRDDKNILETYGMALSSQGEMQFAVYCVQLCTVICCLGTTVYGWNQRTSLIKYISAKLWNYYYLNLIIRAVQNCKFWVSSNFYAWRWFWNMNKK